AVDVPRAISIDHANAVAGAEVEDLGGPVDAVRVADVELRHAEWRRDFVLHHLHLRLAGDHLVAVLHLAGAADLHADRAVELERVSACGGLRVSEHHPDLDSDLVDKYNTCA